MPFFRFSRAASLRNKLRSGGGGGGGGDSHKSDSSTLKPKEEIQGGNGKPQRTYSCNVSMFPGGNATTRGSKIEENKIADIAMTTNGDAEASSTVISCPPNNGENENKDEDLAISEEKNKDDEVAKISTDQVVLRRKKKSLADSPNSEKRTPRNRRRKNPVTYINRRSQHFDDNPPDVLSLKKSQNRKSCNFEEDIELSKKDPLKRFEYLRNGKATSVMIRATPNAVRWDEINRVQYRFQALNFHSDVLEALIHNSPPLSRREHNVATTKNKKNENNDDNNNNVKRDTLRHRDSNNNGSVSSDDDDDDDDDNHNSRNNDMTHVDRKENRHTPSYSRQVQAVKRTNSCDTKQEMERKGSVVQVGAKDDTSDYNSDEDVFQGRPEGDFKSVDYNTTICHVKTGQIKDTTQIHVTSSFNAEESAENKKQTLNKNDLKLLADRATYDDKGSRLPSSAPASTKVSTVTPIDNLAINDRFRSELLNLDSLDGVDLTSKSKEELVSLVKSLQRELETTKHQSYQRTHSPPLLDHSRHSSRRCCSRQDSINEEAFEEEDEEEEERRPLPNVSSLIQNFEQRKEGEGELRRCNTLPYRLRKPPS